MALTWGVFGLANLATYQLLKRKKAEKSVMESTKYKVAFGTYLKKVDKLKGQVQKDYIWLTTNLSRERANGLVILEAYYGLDEHIYRIDSGLLTFRFPTTVEEYYEAQVIPIPKLLTIKIANSQLVLNRADFKQQRLVPNPCINKAARTLLYLRYTFRGLEKILIYDFSRETLTIPHDVQ